MSGGNGLGEIKRASDRIRSLAPSARPLVGIILGSGLADSVPPLDKVREIPYSRIPGFAPTTVAGHRGSLVLGERDGRQVAVMQGRFHYYEGHPMDRIALPTRVLGALGVRALVVTSAVGSMRPGAKPGSLVVVKDHVNFMGHNPLRGWPAEAPGERFPDLSSAYDPGLRRLALSCLRRGGVPAREGVYVAVSGPSYETPAEIRVFRRLGGDVVGMSVVPEVIAARQMGLRALALAWVSNMASGLVKAQLSHEDVLALGRGVSLRLRPVLRDLIRGIDG